MDNEKREHIARHFNQNTENKKPEGRPEHLRFSESDLRRMQELLEAGYVIEDMNNFNGSTYDTTLALGDKKETFNHEVSLPVIVSSGNKEQAISILKDKIDDMLEQYRRRNQPMEDHLL